MSRKPTFLLRLSVEDKVAATLAAKTRDCSLSRWIAEAVRQRLEREGLMPPPPKKNGKGRRRP